MSSPDRRSRAPISNLRFGRLSRVAVICALAMLLAGGVVWTSSPERARADDSNGASLRFTFPNGQLTPGVTGDIRLTLTNGTGSDANPVSLQIVLPPSLTIASVVPSDPHVICQPADRGTVNCDDNATVPNAGSFYVDEAVNPTVAGSFPIDADAFLTTPPIVGTQDHPTTSVTINVSAGSISGLFFPPAGVQLPTP